MVLGARAQIKVQNRQNPAKTSRSPGVPSTLFDTQDTNRQISSKRWGQTDQYKPRYGRIMVLMCGAQLTAQNHQNKAKTSRSPGIPGKLFDTQDTNRQISSKRWGQMDQYKPRYGRIMVLGARAQIKVQNRQNPAKTSRSPGISSTLIDTQDTNRQISSKRWGQTDQYKLRYGRIMVSMLVC
jgi:hypothetical protein